MLSLHGINRPERMLNMQGGQNKNFYKIREYSCQVDRRVKSPQEYKCTMQQCNPNFTAPDKNLHETESENGIKHLNCT